MSVVFKYFKNCPMEEEEDLFFFDLKDRTGTSELTLKETDSGKNSGGTF